MKQKTKKWNIEILKLNPQIVEVVKWGIIYTIAILLAGYIISRLMIVNTLLVILLTAAFVSILAQTIRSHNSNFKPKWFFFYFLIYSTIVWVMSEYVLPEIGFQKGFFSTFVVGFTIAGTVSIIQKIKIKHHSLNWIFATLIIVILVGNLESLGISIGEGLPPITISSPEDEKCPTISSDSLLPINKAGFDYKLIGPSLNKVINNSIWRIEGNIRSCYKGKYKGQRPDWFYCDDMVVSRWDLSNSGTIKYRWYTAVSAEWRPQIGKSNTQYILDGFSCENGQKVIIKKGTTSIYVHDSRDGTSINIEVSGDETPIDLVY